MIRMISASSIKFLRQNITDPLIHRCQVRTTTSSIAVSSTSSATGGRDRSEDDKEIALEPELAHRRPFVVQRPSVSNFTFPLRHQRTKTMPMSITMPMTTNHPQSHPQSHIRPLSSSSAATKDPNLIWQNRFRSDEYRPLWQTPPPQSSSSAPYLHPLPDLRLDNSSQFTLSLLSDMSRNIRRGTDLATSQRCNHVLRLLIHAAGDDAAPARGAGAPVAVTTRCYADRAYLVWKSVEACHDAVQKRHAGEDGMASSKMYEPPILEREVYVELTKLFATANPPPQKSSSRTVHDGPNDDNAERIQDIVTTMSDRYLQTGNLDLRPNVVLWNRVVGSWATSNHVEKSHRAASILRTRLGGDGTGSSLKADLSSYRNVLKACATSDGRDERARRLGAEIAVMVWKELEASRLLESDDGDGDGDGDGAKLSAEDGAYQLREPTGAIKEQRPHIFVFAMRSMELVYRDKMRNTMIQRQFELCKRLGLVNNHVLHAFKSVASPSLVKSQLQNIVEDGRGGGTRVSTAVVVAASTMTKPPKKEKIGTAPSFRQIPATWKRNVS